jgi:hypothetical protein
MIARLTWVFVLALPLMMCGRGAADPPGTPPEVAKKIDAVLANVWAEGAVKKAPAAEDAEFLRRAYLDIAGRIPSVQEAREFLRDTRPDRRTRLVEQLLQSPRYAAHFSNFWRAILIPEASNNFLVRAQQGGFEAWLRKQLAADTGYDRLTRDILTSSMGGQGVGALINTGEPTPAAFFFAKEFKPESLAASTARIFLGASVECAQCHNHPFADWKREQFWSFAAFFSGIQGQRLQDILVPGRETPDKREMTIPGTEIVVQARYLDDSAPAWKEKATSRGTLADWVTAPENPYFARAAVNRVWAYLMGTGLVEPVDDMIGHEPPLAGHTEVLDLLTRQFTAHKFDLKFLIRTITATEAYQRTSAGAAPTVEAKNNEGSTDPALYARMPLRGLTGEQLFDSLAMATGYRDAGNANEDLLAAVLGGSKSVRGGFLTKFANQTEKPIQAQRSILQALALMNGKVIADATSLEKSETLAAIIDAPFLSTAERIETLYLATLTRQPTAKERERAVQFVQEAARHGGADAAAVYNNALADVFWALLNSSEFSLNH